MMQADKTAPKLALYTFGLFMEEDDHPANDSFWELNDRIFAIVDRCKGLIARSGYEGEDGPESWGREVFPHFAREHGRETAPSTLSLWESIEAAMAFAYSGLHAEALRRGREWNIKPAWPPYAAWWWPHDAPPEWSDAVRLHKRLHDNGPSPEVLTFKSPFGPQGDGVTLDRGEIRRLSDLNSQRI